MLFNDQVGVIVTKVLSQTPSELAAEVIDVVHHKSYLLYDRSGFTRYGITVNAGDILLVQGLERRANWYRYGSYKPVLQAIHLQVGTESQIA